MYADRADAGRQLAAALAVEALPADETPRPPIVLAIPRGGLPIGAEVAAATGATLDVVVVRKLRVPWQPELGFGAVGPDAAPLIDHDMVSSLGLTPDQVDAEVADRSAEIRQRLAAYREIRPAADLAGATVVVVDDGVATGGTARMACRWARSAGAAAVLFAAPVGPPDVGERLAAAADTVVVPHRPRGFAAVGQAYRDFHQVSDDEALAAFRAAE